MHKLCAELNTGPNSLSVLDIGTGPSIAQSISVAPYASKIILSDYAAQSRAALTAWLENQEDAHDWMPYFNKIVTEMEGKDEMEVERRIAMVREKVKAVVSCDITEDPPMAEEYMCQYDIVQSFLCLQIACQTKDECFAGIARMASLVKPGGRLILYFSDRNEIKGKSFYVVGSDKFLTVPISSTSVVKGMKNAGFYDIKLSTLSKEKIGFSQTGLNGFYFISATKE